MKVLLRERVARLGDKHDVVDVSNGYAQNFLLPKNLARVASDNEIAHFASQKEDREARSKEREEALAQTVNSMKDVTVTLKASAGENGHLYAGIHAEAIVEALGAQTEYTFEVEHVRLPEPLKELGEHEVTLQAGGVSGVVTVVVEKEE